VTAATSCFPSLTDCAAAVFRPKESSR